MRISQSVEYQLPRPRPPMLRVPTALTSSSLPGLMWGSRASPGDGRASVLLLPACWRSFSCFFVAVGSPGIGFSAGTSAGTCALSAGGADLSVWLEPWVCWLRVLGLESAMAGRSGIAQSGIAASGIGQPEFARLGPESGGGGLSVCGYGEREDGGQAEVRDGTHSLSPVGRFPAGGRSSTDFRR